MNRAYLGTVEKGQFIPFDRPAFRLEFAKREGKECEVTVRAPIKDRSVKQNKYYWAVIVAMIAEFMGERDKKYVHEQLKAKFLMDFSGKLPVIKSSADLSTLEFEEYQSTIREWASEDLEIYIPLPNEVNYD